MRVNRTGITRTVFMFKSFVIKVPNLRYGFRNFLRALLANIDEGNTWRMNSYRRIERDTFLCPVIWYTKTGLLLIMKRADVDMHIREMDIMEPADKIEDLREFRRKYYLAWNELGFGGDDKPNNYGYLDGRLVKTDYAL